jgi:hypothetical protein
VPQFKSRAPWGALGYATLYKRVAMTRHFKGNATALTVGTAETVTLAGG